jgi:hypothetical protein
LRACLNESKKPALAIADESDVEVRVEKDRGGRFPYITFREYGLVHGDDPAIDWET